MSRTLPHDLSFEVAKKELDDVVHNYLFFLENICRHIVSDKKFVEINKRKFNGQ